MKVINEVFARHPLSEQGGLNLNAVATHTQADRGSGTGGEEEQHGHQSDPINSAPINWPTWVSFVTGRAVA